MIAGSGIHASFPSGKKNAAIAGESLPTGGSPSRRSSNALTGPDRIYLCSPTLPFLLLPPDLGDDRQNHHRQPDRACHGVEVLPTPENESQEHEATARNRQQWKERLKTAFCLPGAQAIR